MKAVDFELTRAPSYRVASIVHVGPWKEDLLRREFAELERWAKGQGVRTGAYLLLERGDSRWEACLVVRGRATPEGKIRLKTLPATPIARVVFDPDRISARLVYHGLRDWTRWRKRYGEIRGVGRPREVYAGNPWNDPRAWARCEVQFVVRK